MLYHLFLISFLVVLSGTFSGLTLALFSLNTSTLEYKIALGDLHAPRVYKVRKKGNLLLCTLLLGNVTSYTVIALFLGNITSGIIAGSVSTMLIFLFGEILPQAIFPRYALYIGAKLYWLIWLALIVFYPIAAPIAWILDKTLGKEPPLLWSRDELKELIKYHQNVGDGIIDRDEERIILGALSFSELHIYEVMIPRKEVFFLDSRKVLSKADFLKIRRKGYSRIPIYNQKREKVTGILYAKDLVGLESPLKQNVGEMAFRSDVLVVYDSHNLNDLLNLLIERKVHISIVLNAQDNFIGIITLKDIMQEILRRELKDRKNLK